MERLKGVVREREHDLSAVRRISSQRVNRGDWGGESALPRCAADLSCCTRQPAPSPHRVCRRCVRRRKRERICSFPSQSPHRCVLWCRTCNRNFLIVFSLRFALHRRWKYLDVTPPQMGAFSEALVGRKRKIAQVLCPFSFSGCHGVHHEPAPSSGLSTCNIMYIRRHRRSVPRCCSLRCGSSACSASDLRNSRGRRNPRGESQRHDFLLG